MRQGHWTDSLQTEHKSPQSKGEKMDHRWGKKKIWGWCGKRMDPYWSEREMRVHSWVSHPAPHCMLEGIRSSISHHSTFSRSCGAWLGTTPHKCSSSRIRDSPCYFCVLLSSLFHEIMCNLSVTVCDWIAVILLLPWFQKQKAKKTPFFSCCVFWTWGLAKAEQCPVCAHTFVCTHTASCCGTKKLESGIRKTGWCAGEDQWIWEVHWWQMAGFILWRSDRGGGEPAVSKLQDECIGSTALCWRSSPVPAGAGGYKGRCLGNWKVVVKEGISVIKRGGLVPVPKTFLRVLMIQRTQSHKRMKWA